MATITLDPRELLTEARTRASKIERDLAALRTDREAAIVADLAGDPEAPGKVASLNGQIADAETRLQSLRHAETGFTQQIADLDAQDAAAKADAEARARRAECQRVAKAREGALARADKAIKQLGDALRDARELGAELNALHGYSPPLALTLYAPARFMGLVTIHLGVVGVGPDTRLDKTVAPTPLAEDAKAAHDYHLNYQPEAA